MLCSIALHLHFYVGTQSGFLHICVLANCLIGPPNSITKTLKRHLPLAFCTFMVSSTLVCSLHPLQPNLCGQRVTKLFHISSIFHSWLKTKSSTDSSVGIFENTISHNEASVISNMLNNDKVACVRLPACTCTYGRLFTHLCSVMGVLTNWLVLCFLMMINLCQWC